MVGQIAIRRVAARRGLDWLVAGVTIFRAQPLAWIGSVMLFATLSLVVAAVPIIGPLASAILQPVLLAGLLRAAGEVARGRVLKVSDLFAGCRERTTPLLALGLALGTASFALALVMFAPFAALMGLGYLGPALEEAPEWPGGMPADLDPAMVWVTLAVAVVSLLLAIPVAMAGWFAPALVMLSKLGVVAALKTSFVGCLRNLGPLTLYGLVLMLALIPALIPFGLGLPILLPVGVTSLYAAYREIFGETGGDRSA